MVDVKIVVIFTFFTVVSMGVIMVSDHLTDYKRSYYETHGWAQRALHEFTYILEGMVFAGLVFYLFF
ncbi:hypothetical protein CL630_01430 [bacterium]|nr:hypothetical protein [bacterium]|tara:strand:+ start:21588 stop:21788 length:201 start_codon:yes stop_codon:yes gene_type:complete